MQDAFFVIPFSEPEDPLTCSQEPVIGPCLQSEKCSSHLYTLFLLSILLFSQSNTVASPLGRWIVDSNPTQDMDVCLRLLCLRCPV
jgi:hypothetical protein